MKLKIEILKEDIKNLTEKLVYVSTKQSIEDKKQMRDVRSCLNDKIASFNTIMEATKILENNEVLK